MTTRQEYNNQIADNKAKIAELEAENLELLKAALMTSDEKQWYTEKEEEREKYPNDDRRRKPIIERRLVGRVNWMEKFKDEDTGNVIEVQRSRVVKVNGEWNL